MYLIDTIYFKFRSKWRRLITCSGNFNIVACFVYCKWICSLLELDSHCYISFYRLISGAPLDQEQQGSSGGLYKCPLLPYTGNRDCQKIALSQTGERSCINCYSFLANVMINILKNIIGLQLQSIFRLLKRPEISVIFKVNEMMDLGCVWFQWKPLAVMSYTIWLYLITENNWRHKIVIPVCSDNILLLFGIWAHIG